MVGFSGILGTGQVEDCKMVKDKLRDGKNCEYVKMIRDIGTKFDDYSISQKIRQIILHWVCELTEEGFF